MIKRLLLLLFVLSIPSFATQRAQGWCQQGGKVIVAPAAVGGVSTSRGFMQSYKNCTVTVYITGTGGTLATIYSDSVGTALANPFTADQFGLWYFYAGNGAYDVQISGGGPPALASPYTFGSVWIIDPSRIGGVRYADTFQGLDACVKIQAAIADLPSYGGTVDARAFEGLQTCSANPYGNAYSSPFPKQVTLLLGAAVFQTVVPWQVPTQSRLIGIGRGGTETNTTILADPTFPINTPLVSLCPADNGDSCFGVQVEHLTIDCNGVSGCIGGYNSYAQEESWFQHVLIQNYPSVGLWIDGAPGGTPAFQTQNSGPYEDMEILSFASGTTNTLCIKLNQGVVSRGFHHITCNANGFTSKPTTAISVNSTRATLTNIGIQDVTQGVLIGDVALGGSNITLINVECGDVVGNCSPVVRIAANVNNISLFGVSGNNSAGAGNVVQDDCNSVTIPDSSVGVGVYVIGEGGCGSKTILTTRTDVNTIIRSPATEILSNLSVPGTNNNDGILNLGLSSNIKLWRQDTGGVGGGVLSLSDGNGIVIQQQNMTQGPLGGGLALQGGGVHAATDRSTAIVQAGALGDGGTFTATSTTPSFMLMTGGSISFFGDTGKTPGSVYSPSQRMYLPTTGGVGINPIAFASLGAPSNGVVVYCSDCTNQSNACTGGGSGAIAKRLAGAWDCR